MSDQSAGRARYGVNRVTGLRMYPGTPNNLPEMMCAQYLVVDGEGAPVTYPGSGMPRVYPSRAVAEEIAALLSELDKHGISIPRVNAPAVAGD